MANDTAQKFMSALKKLEQSRDVEIMTAMFSDNATLKRLSQREDYEGQEGAAKFWQEYLSSFGELQTTFHRTVQDGNQAVLEWESKGILPGGEPLHYSGVSWLELDGDRVTNFRTYYDSAAFVPLGAGS